MAGSGPGFGHRRAWNPYHQSPVTVSKQPLGQMRWLVALRKIQAARSSVQVTHHALSRACQKMPQRFVANSTMEANNFVCRLDRSGAVVRSPPHTMQRLATTLLCETKHQRDFSRPIASRASKVSGPSFNHRIAQVLLALRCASRVTRRGLTV